MPSDVPRRAPTITTLRSCIDAAATLRDRIVDIPDAHGSFAADAMERLRAAHLLAAPVPTAYGGVGLGDPENVQTLRAVLTAVGRASLVLGRLYEGHVNALALVFRYGARPIREHAACDAKDGHLFGVWNTQPDQGGLEASPSADGLRLTGAKTYASGAGSVTRALVTAALPDRGRVMLVVPLAPGERADLSQWRAHGMRASATGRVDFTGMVVEHAAVIGEPGDYLRQPFFSCGAWRFLAVQCGGIEAVFEAHREHLRRSGRGQDPLQRARLGQAATAVETARLFVARAASRAAQAERDPAGAVAYVDLARGAVERAGLDAMELAQRSVGLAGFLEGHPLERLARDLSTYLRQPMPDAALAAAADHLLEASAPLDALWPSE